MDEEIFLKQDVIMAARTYRPFLRLARLIFWLHGLKWRKIHALNDESPKKVLEILVSKPFQDGQTCFMDHATPSGLLG